MEKRLLIVPALLATLAGAAQAEPSTQVAWTPEALALVKAGNAGHGQELAKNQGCDGCHTGNAMPEAPSLNGQLPNYLYRQLHDYKDRGRANETMSAMAAGLSQQDMADLAAWYAGRDVTAAPVPKETGETAQRLASQGDSRRLIPACAACHGGNGQGQAQDIPRLAGQNAVYLAATLHAYKTGQRRNDVYRRMRDIAAALSGDEIRLLSDYYAGLH